MCRCSPYIHAKLRAPFPLQRKGQGLLYTGAVGHLYVWYTGCMNKCVLSDPLANLSAPNQHSKPLAVH